MPIDHVAMRRSTLTADEAAEVDRVAQIAAGFLAHLDAVSG